MTRPRAQRTLVATGLGLAVVLALIVLPPVAALFRESVVDAGPGLTLDHYRKLLSADLTTLIVNSLVFAAGSTAVSLLFGGVVLARMRALLAEVQAEARLRRMALEAA